MVEWRKFVPGEKYLNLDWMDRQIPKTHPFDSSHGWCLRHPNTTFRYNPTVPAGTALDSLTGLMNNLQNRWDFNVVKVDEWLEVSPSHPHYKTIIMQKEDIIRRVKEGLTSVDRAVSDVELLAHDARRYKQILDFFAKDDEHSLKAMFIDQVDVHLPEGVSMRTIAPRWPTIIGDFLILKDEDDTVKKVRKKIEVSNAEAYILATKVRLYKKWKKFFGGEVKNRYRRILERLEGRKRTIDEYRNWIRPLIRRVMQMREVDDSTLIMDSNLPIGTGAPVSLRYIEYWAWTKLPGLEPTGPHKAPRIRYEARETGAEYIGTEKMKVWGEAVPRFRIEPYDEVVKKFIPEIEKRHGVEITKKDVLDARKRLFEKGSPGVEWYVLVHFPVGILTYKLPSGLEVDDVDINEMSSIFITHNLMLVKILELIAEEKKLDVYIDELLGKKITTEEGVIKEIEDLLKEDYPEIYGKKEEEAPTEFVKSVSEFKSSVRKSLRSALSTINNLFGLKLGLVKGPYDPLVKDRLFYGYGRPYLREVFFGKIWVYLKKNFGAV